MLPNLLSAAVVIGALRMICLMVNGTLFFSIFNGQSQLMQMKKYVINFLMTIHMKYQVFGCEKQDFLFENVCCKLYRHFWLFSKHTLI